ncbi:MAG: DUF433 domain-containing protein [Bacteroidetes bacterium]|nr:DUF433 domain-containing protein [Bacteroidota bacterium]
MNLHEYITVSPDIQFGRPVFKGTRVTVDTLFFHLEQGISLDDFLQDFPGVSRDQVEGVLESTARLFQSSNIGKLDEIIA